MADNPHYARAPITEAIIDLQVIPGGEVSLSAFEEFGGSQEGSYPTKKSFHVAEGVFQVGAETSASTRTQQVGFVFISHDEKQVVRVHRNGFTFSRLSPYQRWAPFCQEARRLWTSYRHALKPERVSRIAVRFVNRFDLPGPRVELKDYLSTGPEVALALTEPLAGFFLRLVFPQNDLKAVAILNEMMVEPAHANGVSVVLDIDLYREEMLPADEDELWRVFEELRIRKNRIFEACITDRTRELIR